MTHPLGWVAEKDRRPLFWIFLAGSLAMLFLFQPLNRPLMTPASPNGIISLQLAWTSANAQAMLDSWDAAARLFAAFGLGFDYLFMLVYAVALGLASLHAAGRHPGWFSRLGTWIAYGTFAAGILDGLENLGQFHVLFNGRVDLAFVIGLCATIKFTFLALAILYGLTGWFWPKKS